MKFKVTKLPSHLKFSDLPFLPENPLKYLEECENPGLPERENIYFCVRVFADKRIKEKENYHRAKAYQCYSFQENKWWKTNYIEFLIELHVPKMSLRQYLSSGAAYRFMTPEYQRDCDYWRNFLQSNSLKSKIEAFRFFKEIGLKRKALKSKNIP
jgi:hypothetical protein